MFRTILLGCVLSNIIWGALISSNPTVVSSGGTVFSSFSATGTCAGTTGTCSPGVGDVGGSVDVSTTPFTDLRFAFPLASSGDRTADLLIQFAVGGVLPASFQVGTNVIGSGSLTVTLKDGISVLGQLVLDALTPSGSISAPAALDNIALDILCTGECTASYIELGSSVGTGEVPEPTAWLMGAIGSSLLLISRRRSGG